MKVELSAYSMITLVILCWLVNTLGSLEIYNEGIGILNHLRYFRCRNVFVIDSISLVLMIRMSQ